MSGSKIRSMTITALVLINVVFLTVIVIGAVEDARSERQAIENACFMLRGGGIEVDPDSIRVNSELRTMRTVRGDEAEAAIARALLGEAEMTDLGVIFLYESADSGTAEFFSAGDFEVLLNEGVITNNGGPLRTVQRLLRDMKLETAAPVLSGEPGYETVTAVSAFRGANIFNSLIEFVFNGESLETVSGRYAAGFEVAEGGAVMSSASTALLSFLAAVQNEEIECSRIYDVEAGYQHLAGLLGESVISPAWLVTADSGQYIVDDATGEVRAL